MPRTKLRDLEAGLRRPVKELLERGGEREELAALLEKKGHGAEEAMRVAEDLDREYQDRLRSGAIARDDSPRPLAAEGACSACGARLTPGDAFCDACGAKVLSEEDEFHLRTNVEPAMRKGAQWIGAVAILYMLGGVLFFVITEDPMVMVVNFALAAIQAGLWHWAKTNLLPAAIVALVLYLTVHLAEAVVDPTSIVRGIIVKVIFLVVLARAIQAGLEARRLRRPAIDVRGT